MRRLRLFLDANVLVDAQTRDLLLRVAEAGFIEVRWSERVLSETERALSQLVDDGTRRRRLLEMLRAAFPRAVVSGYESVEKSLVLPDADDRHVLAAASIAECDLIVTNNLRDFPEAACREHDLLAVGVDDALLLVAGEAGPALPGIVRGQISAMQRPTTTAADFVERLSSRAPHTATMIGAAMGLATYQRILAEVLRADSSDGPQQAVRALLDAVRRSDAPTLFTLVDEPLRSKLLPPDEQEPEALMELMKVLLRDVVGTEGWGFATAWRPQSPDIELVKLVQWRNGSDCAQPRTRRRPPVLHAAGWDLMGPARTRWPGPGALRPRIRHSYQLNRAHEDST